MRVCAFYLDFYRFTIYSRHGGSSRNGYFKSKCARLVFRFGFNKVFLHAYARKWFSSYFGSGCRWSAADGHVVARSIWRVSCNWCTNVFAVLFGLKETLPAERRKEGGLTEVLRTFSVLLKDGVFVGYALAQGFIMSAMFAYISGSTFVLQDIYGLSPQMFSFVFAINGFGLIIATQVTGRLAGKVKEATLLMYGLLQAAVGSVLLVAVIATHTSVILVCILLFFVVSSVGIVNTTVFHLLCKIKLLMQGVLQRF